MDLRKWIDENFRTALASMQAEAAGMSHDAIRSLVILRCAPYGATAEQIASLVRSSVKEVEAYLNIAERLDLVTKREEAGDIVYRSLSKF